MPDMVGEILDALQRFDAETAPQGLYASREFDAPEYKPFPEFHQEWHKCLKPLLRKQSCHVDGCHIKSGSFAFTSPDGEYCSLDLVRTSKVKVRKYGSQYRIDPTQKYPLRWASLEMHKRIAAVWSPYTYVLEKPRALQVLVFIGFEAKPEPFEEELSELRDSLDWESYGVEFQSRTWDDQYGRAFHVRLCSWSYRVDGK